MKCVVIQGDGMADEPLAELGGKTPLDHGRTPHLDHLASRGIFGLTRTIPRGLPPASEVGTLSVLGYDPTRHRCGGAALEAVSLGVGLGAEDVAFRANLVTLEAGEDGAELLRDFAGGHPSAAEARAMVADLQAAVGGGEFEFHATSSYRHLLVWRGGESRLRTVSPHDLADKPIARALPEGPRAEALRDLMARARAVLSTHPACAEKRARGERVPTAIWPWGPARRAALPTVPQRFAIEGSVVAGVDLACGLGMLAGLERVTVPGATGFFDTNYLGKAEGGLRALEERDFLFLHVEAPDEGGHMGDVQRKVEAIENLDAQVVGPLLEGLRRMGGEWRILVMPDHATPCATRTNSAEPVPFVVYVSADDAKARGVARGYSERDGRDYGIFIPEAHTLLERLVRR
jgi:2,3-bisphosphoglycerate-independent phosphoglycerate mutase